MRRPSGRRLHRPAGICWEHNGDGLFARERITTWWKRRYRKWWLRRLERDVRASES